MVVANMCGISITEEVVVSGSEKSKQLANLTLPVLEIDANTITSDSSVIASYIAQSSGNKKFLGANDFEVAQCDQWLDFLKTETTPIVKAI